MNLRSYDKSTRLLAQANLAANGINLGGENNVSVIGIIDCAQNGTDDIVKNLAFGIRKSNGVPLTYNLPNFDYLARITPATAKYARNYIDTIAKQTEAIVRTNVLDGLVAVVDNHVMGMGVLEGCTRSNCPVLLMPTGMNPNYDESIFAAAGKVATREIKSTEVDEVINAHARQIGIAPHDTLTVEFFKLAEAFGLTLPKATTLQVNTGATLNFALETGVEAMQRADDIITTKRLISKRTLTESLEKYKTQNGNATGILLYQNLLNMVDLKLPNNLFPTLKGFVDQAYVVSEPTAPLTMQGQAWVYRSLTDAMTALCSNAIDNGIIVLQNCTDCDVSLVAKTIVAMNKPNEIALITDGYCATTPVLTVANVTPDAFANEDFANLQNGDLLEIDVAKGRLTTDTSSKDMKIRAKRNIVKKHEIYF